MSELKEGLEFEFESWKSDFVLFWIGMNLNLSGAQTKLKIQMLLKYKGYSSITVFC